MNSYTMLAGRAAETIQGYIENYFYYFQVVFGVANVNVDAVLL